MVRACGAIVGARHASPAPCAAHTYCDYSRHCCHWCAEHTNYRCCDYSFQNILVGYCGRGVTHTYRSLTGEACLAPTKPCFRKAINTILLLLQAAHELQMLRLFIPKHHCRLLRARHYIYHPYLFCGRGVPRPYKALPPQGYERDFTAITEALRLSLKLERLLLPTSYFLLPTSYLREAEARRAAIHDNGSSACVSQ